MPYEDSWWDERVVTQAPPAPQPEPWTETRVVGQPIPRVDGDERGSGSAVYPPHPSPPPRPRARARGRRPAAPARGRVRTGERIGCLPPRRVAAGHAARRGRPLP